MQTPDASVLSLLSAVTAAAVYLHAIPFFFYLSGDHRDLHSFPTRRSSDLRQHGIAAVIDLRAEECDDEESLRAAGDRKSTRLNSSHSQISYAVFCLKKKKTSTDTTPTQPQTKRRARCLIPRVSRLRQ